MCMAELCRRRSKIHIKVHILLTQAQRAGTTSATLKTLLVEWGVLATVLEIRLKPQTEKYKVSGIK